MGPPSWRGLLLYLRIRVQSLVSHDSGDEYDLGAIPDNATDVPEELAPPVVLDVVLDSACALESPSEDIKQKSRVLQRSGRTRKRPDFYGIA